MESNDAPICNHNMNSAPEYREGIRESMSCLPVWMQPLITMITGKPLPFEKPVFTNSPRNSFFITLFLISGMMILNVFLLSNTVIYGFVLLPVTWIICTGQIRKIQVVYAHHCVHRTFFKNKPKINDFMLEVLTIIVLVQNGDEYRRDHLGHHSRELFTTKNDSDAALLFELGFLPSLKANTLWKKLFVVMFSPKFHWFFLKSRFYSNLINRPLGWRLLAIVWALTISIGLAMTFVWWHIALVVWLPIFIFYNASALLQFITEHAWMISDKSPKSLDSYADRCWGRFFGDACPAIELRGVDAAIQWSIWSCRMLFVHAPIRFGCFVGDLPAHDWHHLCTFKDYDPASWPVALYSRQLMIDSGHGLGMESRELWGLHSMLNHAFNLLESAGETFNLDESKAA